MDFPFAFVLLFFDPFVSGGGHKEQGTNERMGGEKEKEKKTTSEMKMKKRMKQVKKKKRQLKQVHQSVKCDAVISLLLPRSLLCVKAIAQEQEQQ